MSIILLDDAVLEARACLTSLRSRIRQAASSFAAAGQVFEKKRALRGLRIPPLAQG